MEPTNKSSVTKGKDSTVIEFLPDADEIEVKPYSLFARITLYFLITTFASFVGWSIIAEVDRVVVAPGKLITSSSNIIVQPLETSIIKTFHVRSGQVVKKGELLATLDSTFAEADKEQLRTKLNSLDTQVERMVSELSGRAAVNLDNSSTDSMLQEDLSIERIASYKAQLANLESKVSRLKSEAKTNRRDQRLMVSRVKVLREMEEMKEKLVAQQSVAKVSLLEARERRLQVEREMQLTIRRGKELQKELILVQAGKNAFAKDWRQKTMEELLTVSRTRDALREQLQKADKRRNMVSLRSPANAVVLEKAKLSEGSVVRAAETLFTLVPVGTTFQAEVRINSMDIAYVNVGSDVHLKFDAFPFQRHGVMDGKIRTISEDAFQPDASMGGTSAYYLGKVRMGNTRLKNMTKESRLLPGMTLSAEIVVGKRSIISYLLWPLTKSLNDSTPQL